MRTKVVYIRIPASKHRQLCELVAHWETSLSSAVERMIDQTLYQCVVEYEEPAWLADAVAAGLPILRCGAVDLEVDEMEANDVVRLAGHH